MCLNHIFNHRSTSERLSIRTINDFGLLRTRGRSGSRIQPDAIAIFSHPEASVHPIGIPVAMSAATDQAGRYMCHCGKGFLRKEHLRRHQATHAQPSFVCPVCDRSFTRSDVLRRHVAVHDSASVSPVRNWKACDACHENKTRCDGGEQCTLCNKRGIPCTYSRDGVKNAEVTAAAPDSTSSSGQSQDDQPDPMQIEPQLAADSHQPESLPTVTQDRQSKGDFQAARVGLTCVMDAISAEITGKKAAPSSSEHIQKWLPSCVSVYFGRFHERWTLVHAPVFDANTDSALLVGTVLIIASWQRDHKSLRGLIISIHDRLMAYLFRKLVRFQSGIGNCAHSTRPCPSKTRRSHGCSKSIKLRSSTLHLHLNQG